MTIDARRVRDTRRANCASAAVTSTCVVPALAAATSEEIALPTWRHFTDADPLTPRAVEQLVLGVSTRNYERSLEPTPAGIESRGTSKSAVSRRFVSATEQTLTEMMGRDLRALSICALIFDGIHVNDHLVVWNASQ